jgi:hypothetical protein
MQGGKEVLMESVRQWFQDWSDACEYAKECAPDFSFLSSFTLGEPYTALLSILGACWLLWAFNERSIRRSAAALRRQMAQSAALSGARDALQEMKGPTGKEEKLAA